MFKSRRKLVRKRRESCQFTDRGGGKPRKNEGNSNITSNRLTIPPGFLCLGIKSETVRKSTDEEKPKPQRDYILTEDLHSLFGNNSDESVTKPRRSSRILKKVEEAQNLDSLSASDYYSKVLTQNNNTENNTEDEEIIYKNKSALKTNSKSLFRKINERCARAAIQNNINFNYNIRPIIGENVKVEVFKPTSFCQNLSKEIQTEVLKDNNAVLNCKLAILKKTQKINDILCGRANSDLEMSNNNQNTKTEADNNVQEEEQKYIEYIPKCDWIYETPPRQRITLPKIDECAIQPAVICTTRKKSNIYELNPSVNVDLTNYVNRQNVEVDGKYLRHLASFEDKIPSDLGMEYIEAKEVQNQGVREGGDSYNYFPNKGEHSNGQFTFVNPFLNAAENHFMPVMSRPTKPLHKGPRIKNVLKRKLEEFDSTPTSSNYNQADDQFETDFTFIEDNGKFKMVNSQCSTENKDFNFSFKKNVFKVCEEENIFNFKKDEPKMFDFTQLDRNDC